MRARQARPAGSDGEARKRAGLCGLFAALGWAVAELLFDILLGPHLRPVRAMAVGSGIGAAVGLIISVPQWLLQRRRLPGAGLLVPMVTAAATLSGMVCGLLLNFLVQSMDLYGLTVPLQGAAGAAVLGALVAAAQHYALKDHTTDGNDGQRRVAGAIGGSALAGMGTCLVAALSMSALEGIVDRGAWPYLLLGSHVAAGFAGGAIYGLFTAWEVKRALTGPTGGIVSRSATDRAQRVRPAPSGGQRNATV